MGLTMHINRNSISNLQGPPFSQDRTSNNIRGHHYRNSSGLSSIVIIRTVFCKIRTTRGNEFKVYAPRIIDFFFSTIYESLLMRANMNTYKVTYRMPNAD